MRITATLEVTPPSQRPSDRQVRDALEVAAYFGPMVYNHIGMFLFRRACLFESVEVVSYIDLDDLIAKHEIIFESPGTEVQFSFWANLVYQDGTRLKGSLDFRVMYDKDMGYAIVVPGSLGVNT